MTALHWRMGLTVLVVDGPADFAGADAILGPDAAAFSNASDAVACATRLGRRAGLHTGDAERARHIRDCAHPGQVLLSGATRVLLPDLEAKDLGVHRLRDLGRPEHLFQLGDGEFPTARTLDAVPNNLPVQLTTFIGRSDELARFTSLSKDTRLLTVTGAGGCGKTRLTLHAVARRLDDYPDGVWFVDLAPRPDPTAALAAVLGLKDEPVTTHLATRRTLIVLDNCETVVAEAAALAEQLLRECGSVTVVATSREPLGVDGEVTWRIPNLALASADAGLTASDAVRLFIDTAVRVRPNFQVTNETAPAVAQICQRLDGIPLAIILAAARVRVLSPQQIAAGLDDRFRTLGAGPRSAVPRHQTLRASIDSSWDLLSERERVLFRRVAVFPSSFDLDAAEAICADDDLDRWHVLETLTGLVDRSLVVADEYGAVTRYRMLETIRQYAAELAQSELETLRHKHLLWYSDLAERLEPDLATDQPPTLERVDGEWDNFRAALAHGLETDAESGGRLMAALLIWFYVRSAYRDWASFSKAYVASTDLSEQTRAAMLLSLGFSWGLELLDDPSPSGTRSILESGLEIARRIGDRRLEGRLLTWLGNAVAFLDPDGAGPVIDEALRITRETQDVWFVLEGLQIAAFPALRRGDPARAEQLSDEALDICRSVRDPDHEGTFHTISGQARLLRGDLRAAAGLARRGLDAARTSGNMHWVGVSAVLLGRAMLRLGDVENAARAFGDLEALPHPVPRVLSRAYRGIVALTQGDVGMAAPLLAEVTELWRAHPAHPALLELVLAAAECHHRTGDAERARALADEVLELTRRLHLRSGEGRALVMLAMLDRDEDRYHEALRVHVETGDRIGVVDTLEALAGIAASNESLAEAARLYGAAQQLRAETGYVRYPIRAVEIPEGFDAAFAEGRAMSLDQAVSYAQKGRGERKRPSTGWASLTPAELDVVRLVAEGMTNAQIASRLFITVGTVKTHVGHIFAKLGATTRSEVAVLATHRLAGESGRT